MHHNGPRQFDGSALEVPLSEIQELELASELLEVASEHELEHFLGHVFQDVGSALGAFMRSDTAHALGGMLKDAAVRALPVVARAIGERVAPPHGAEGEVAHAAGSLLGLELEGLSPQDQEFEAARQFVRLAGAAANHALLAPAGLPPAQTAQRAAAAAAERFAPGLAHEVGRPRQGMRRGSYSRRPARPGPRGAGRPRYTTRHPGGAPARPGQRWPGQRWPVQSRPGQRRAVQPRPGQRRAVQPWPGQRRAVQPWPRQWRPGQAYGRPGQAYGRPGRAYGRPGLAYGQRPWQVGYQPTQYGFPPMGGVPAGRWFSGDRRWGGQPYPGGVRPPYPGGVGPQAPVEAATDWSRPLYFYGPSPPPAPPGAPGRWVYGGRRRGRRRWNWVPIPHATQFWWATPATYAAPPEPTPAPEPEPAAQSPDDATGGPGPAPQSPVEPEPAPYAAPPTVPAIGATQPDGATQTNGAAPTNGSPPAMAPGPPDQGAQNGAGTAPQGM